MNSSPFTPNFWYAMNPPDFILFMLEMYDRKAVPMVHFIRFIHYIEVLGASEEVMGWCFPLYLIYLEALWFRQLENSSITYGPS